MFSTTALVPATARRISVTLDIDPAHVADPLATIAAQFTVGGVAAGGIGWQGARGGPGDTPSSPTPAWGVNLEPYRGQTMTIRAQVGATPMTVGLVGGTIETD